MKKGQTAIGLVILGVVSIIAVIGLVLLFTRASSEGALLSDLAISDTYSGSPRGIAETYPAQPIGSPQVEHPFPPGTLENMQIVGTRIPAFIVHGGYASLEDVPSCNRDLTVVAGMAAINDKFNCYTVPNIGPPVEVEGFYPPTSSAEARPPTSYRGKIGGDVYCYANFASGAPNSERLVRENILTSLVDNKGGQEEFEWGAVFMNGERVPVCWVSKKVFPFPQ